MHKMIVFEGIDGTGKTSIGKLLSKAINGLYYASPPEALQQFRHVADDSTAEARSYFYLFGNIITTAEMSKLLEKQHIVVDRYFYSTNTYYKLSTGKEFPSTDIRKPDHIILLTTDMDVIEERLSKRDSRSKFEGKEFLRKKQEVFKDVLRDEDVITVDTSTTTAEEVCAFLVKELGF